ncbi:MAG TPA: hypothetical protein VE782_09105 [Myxococcaceae bacterium]|nr:hypothetical protein [Myxococcaceae bacterium]
MERWYWQGDSFPEALVIGLGLLSTLLAAGPARPLPATIAFSELFEQSGVLTPSARVLSLQGKRVRMVGFMARMEVAPNGGFYLCPRPVLADESGAGTGDLPVESVFVVMSSARGRAVPYRQGLLEVTGRLYVGNRTDQEGRVSAFQIVLDPPVSRRRVSRSPSASARGVSK